MFVQWVWWICALAGEMRCENVNNQMLKCRFGWCCDGWFICVDIVALLLGVFADFCQSK